MVRKSEKFNLSVSIPKVLIDFADEHAANVGVTRAEYIRALLTRDVIAPMDEDTVYKLTYIVSRANVADIDKETIMNMLQVFTIPPADAPELNMPELEKKRQDEESALKAEQAKRKKYENIIEQETKDPVSDIERKEKPVDTLRKEIAKEEKKRRGISVPKMSDVDLM